MLIEHILLAFCVGYFFGMKHRSSNHDKKPKQLN